MHAIGAGREDYDNKYQTAVKVLSANGTCSGILIAPRLVLTAAHCFCKITEKPLDRSICQKEATVIRVFYFYDDAKKTWRGDPDSTKGRVIVHDDYASQYKPGTIYIEDDKKLPDLAVVRLDRALMAGSPPGGTEDEKELQVDVKLGRAEVSLDQEVVVVGYGATAARGKDVGTRRFGGKSWRTCAWSRRVTIRGGRFGSSSREQKLLGSSAGSVGCGWPVERAAADILDSGQGCARREPVSVRVGR